MAPLQLTSAWHPRYKISARLCCSGEAFNFLPPLLKSINPANMLESALYQGQKGGLSTFCAMVS